MDHAMKQSTQQFHSNFFNISKCLACNAEKTLQLKIMNTRKKRMNTANFINIQQIYIPILYVTRMNQNKNDLVNAILQYTHIFPTSRLPYLILCPR